LQSQRGGDRSGSDRDVPGEHLFELKQAYEAWQFSLTQVEKVDEQIALQLGRMKCDRALPPLTLKRKARQLGLELIERPSAGSGTVEAAVQG